VTVISGTFDVMMTTAIDVCVTLCSSRRRALV